MKIVGFGDSFILGITPQYKEWQGTYQQILSDRYKTIPEFKGIPGSGPWNAFFDFLKYFQTSKEKVDVVLMAWSEAYRLYNPYLTQENAKLAAQATNRPDITYKDVFLAVHQYQEFVFDSEKTNYELKALMTMFDDMVLDYPNTKFINLHSFSWLSKGESWKDFNDSNKLKYHYRFKNSMEIRPALIHLSRLDGWPGDDKMHLENRECHLSIKMHRLLGDAIIDCIDKYQPGKLVNIDLESNV